MKRKPGARTGARLGDILQATTIEQRAWIGAVALAYNDAEGLLHRLAGACFGMFGRPYSFTSRINGTDGLIAIIEETVASMGMADDILKLFRASLVEHGFAYLKGLRDAVIHARLFDSGIGIGEAPGKRGKRPEEVLLTPGALEGLYKRLAILCSEFGNLETILLCQKTIAYSHLFGALDDQRKADNERDIQAATALCQSHQNRRLSLRPFPEFPAQPKIHQLLPQWLSFDGPKSISVDFGKKE